MAAELADTISAPPSNLGEIRARTDADVGRLFYACGMDQVFQGPLGWRRAAVVFSTRPSALAMMIDRPSMIRS
jgi:hypothetical protein